jgi:hypothetical protein
MPEDIQTPSIKRADADILSGLNINSGYGGMESAVKGLSSLPGLTETILPSIKALLMPGENNPAFKAIDAGTQQSVASAQTDAMRRGLTGSDIEAASMVGARQGGEMAKSNFQAQTATQLAGFIKDLATGDINSQRENLLSFAQLMGQKITNDNDLEMFRSMLQENMAQSARNSKSSLWGAGIGAVGSIAGGAAAKFSDERLKVGIRKIGEAAGLRIVVFRWTRLAQAFGAHDQGEVGVLAQDVESRYPSAVSEKNGWKMVDYTKLPASVFETANRLGVAYA